jgi:hypothetical protein
MMQEMGLHLDSLLGGGDLPGDEGMALIGSHHFTDF